MATSSPDPWEQYLGPAPGAGGGGGAAPAPQLDLPLNLTPEQRAWVERMKPLTIIAGKELGIHPNAILAQAALETGWGKSTPGGDSHNLFGIKASPGWRGGSVDSETTEFADGVAHREQEPFRSYASDEESVSDYTAFLRDNPRYKEAMNSGSDIQNFATALQASGYATDPQYAAKLINIATRLEEPQAPAPAPAVAPDEWTQFLGDPLTPSTPRVSAASPRFGRAEPEARDLTSAFMQGSSTYMPGSGGWPVLPEKKNDYRYASIPTPNPMFNFLPGLRDERVPDVAPGTSMVGPLSDAYSMPSQLTVPRASPDENMAEIEVGAPQPLPGVRWPTSYPESSWGYVFRAMPAQLGGKIQLWKNGVLEMLNDAQAPGPRLELLKTIVIPDAYKRFQAAKTEAGGEPFQNDMLNDPAIVKAAAMVEMPVTRFLQDWYDYAGIAPQEQAQKISGLLQNVGANAQRARELTGQRNMLDRGMEMAGPSVEPLTPKWAVSGGAQIAPELGTAVGAGLLGGPAAALSVLAGTVAPQQYETGKSMDFSPGQAGLFTVLTTAAEILPEAPVMETLLHTPAGKALLKKAFGRFVNTAAGKAAGAGGFEAFAEGITQILQDLTKAGMLNEHVTFGQLMGSAGEAAVMGWLPGASLAIPGARRAARDERVERDLVGPLPRENKLSDALAAASVGNKIGMNPRQQGATQAARKADVAAAVPPPVGPVFPPEAATMPAPRATGSRAPEAGAVEGSAPTPASTQGTATAPPTAAALQQELKQGATYQAPDGEYAVVSVSPNSDPDKHFLGLRGPDGDLRPWTASEFAAHIAREQAATARQADKEKVEQEAAQSTKVKKYADLSSALRRPTPVPEEARDEKSLLTALAQMQPPVDSTAAQDKGARFDALVAQVAQPAPPATRADVENFAALSSKLREGKKPEPPKSEADQIALATAQMQKPDTAGATKEGASFDNLIAGIKNPAPTATAAPTEPAPTPVPQAVKADSTTQQPPAVGAVSGAPSVAPTVPAPAAAPRPKNRAAPLAEHEQARVKTFSDRLRSMANTAGWWQQGGKRLQAMPNDMLDADKPGVGENSPTTTWIPKSPWWPPVQAAHPLKNNKDGSATSKAVEKAIAGKSLTPTEYGHVQAMVESLTEIEREAEAQGAQDVEGSAASAAVGDVFGPAATRQDVIDMALVDRANELDEVGVERAAIQNENNDKGYMDAIRAIIAKHEQAQKADESGAAVPADQGAQEAGAGQPVLTPSPGPPADKGPVKPAKTQGELLPKDEKAQALADATRAKDEARSPGKQVSAGVGGGLFSDEQKQTDLTDQASQAKPDEAATDDDETVTTLDEDVGTAAASGAMDLRRPEQETKKAKPAGPYSDSREGPMSASHFEQIWTENGLNPNDMENLAPQAQLAKAVELLKTRYGFGSVTVSNEINVGEAIDIVKDAYVGLSNLAAIQNVAPQVMSLNGWLKLHLVRTGKGGALASYHPKTHVITMTRRNDAFAHEWAHALDNYVLLNFAPELAQVKGLLLTGKIRRGGEPQTLDAQVTQAFIDVLNAMFFDQAKGALYIQTLQQQIAVATTPSQKAKLQEKLDNFLKGSGRPKIAESEYYQHAVQFDGKPFEDEDKRSYWQRPTEMFARAFEAYIAHKLDGLGAASVFVTDSDRLYQKGRTGQFNAAYPQATDRQVIFDALDLLMRAVRDRGLVKNGNTSPLIDATAPPYWQGQAPSLTTPQTKQARSVWTRIKEAIKERREENKRDARADEQRAKADKSIRDAYLDAANPGKVKRYFWNMGLRIANGWNALAAAKLTSIQSFMLSMSEKLRGNQGMEQLRKWFAPDPGAARGVQNASFELVVKAEIKSWTNKFADVVRKHDMSTFNDAELRNVRDVIVGAEKPISDKTRDAAADIKKFNNDLHVYMTQAGIDVGYVRENGWMKRVMDPLAVEENLDEFRTQARAVYESVYEEEIGTLAELGDLTNPAKLNSLLKYVTEIANTGRVPQASRLADALKPLAKEIAQLVETITKDPNDAQAVTDFHDKLDELRDMMRVPWAMEATHDWETHIRGLEEVERFNIEGRGPDGKFTKSRKLPALADELLGDFMVTNPLQLTQTYLTQVVRRVQFGKFFGEETRSGKPLGWKLNDALTAAKGEYIGPNGKTLRANPDDVEEMMLSIDTILRQGSRGFLTKRQLRWMSRVNTLLIPVFLARSLASQIAEPFTVGWRTGNPIDSLRVFYSQMQDVAGWLGHQPSRVRSQFRREMSNYLGVTTDHLADHLINNRYNLMYQDVGSAKLMARFFMVSGVQPHAMSMRRGAADVMLTRYIPSMATRALGTGPKARQAREALQEIGINPTPEILAECQQLANIKSVTELSKLRHYPQIRMAAVQLVDQGILDPTIAHKPRFASQPEMSFAYGIMSMNFAFQREVIQASAKRIAAAWANNPKIGAATVGSVAASAVLLASGQFAAWVMRSMLFGRDDWEEVKKKIESEGFWQAMSRSGYFGAADPLINAMSALKYERDLTNVAVGALPSAMMSAVQTWINLAGSKNSPNSAYAEDKAIESAWTMGVTPAVTSLLLKWVAGKNAGVDAALGLGLAFLGSSWVTGEVAEPLAEGMTGDEYKNSSERREEEEARGDSRRSRGRSSENSRRRGDDNRRR